MRPSRFWAAHATASALSTGVAHGDEQTNRSENIVWTTNDVPFNVAVFDEALVSMRLLVSSRDDALLKEMQQRMKGYQMGVDYENWRFPWKTRRVMRVVEIAEKSSPLGIFSVAVGFHRLGAILVGTPSAQAPNSFGAAAIWKLNHTGIEGMVPMIAATHFPDNPEKAHVLQVDVPLTYERLASYGLFGLSV